MYSASVKVTTNSDMRSFSAWAERLAENKNTSIEESM
jgi:hypothetical protein